MRGFSLVELSIVLVILGLLTGGVLVARSLIQAAHKHSILAQHGEIVAATYKFRDKYLARPGDMSRATAFFPATTQPQQVTNGNGDGRISALFPHVTPHFKKWGGGTDIYEYNSVFDHLAAAGLVSLPQYDETNWDGAASRADRGYPLAKYRSAGDLPATSGGRSYTSEAGIKIGWLDGHYHVRAGNAVTWTMCAWNAWGNGMNSCGLIAEDAHGFDVKLDDAKPYSGKFVIIAPGSEPYRLPGSGVDATGPCADATNNSYKIANTAYRGCDIVLRVID